MQLRAIALLALSAVCGCGGMFGGGGPSPLYELATNRQQYDRGNTGEVTIRNASKEALEYNPCQRRLERRVEDRWVAAFEWPTAGGACTAEARRLDPRASVTTLFEIPTGVPAGSYRVVFTGLLGPDKTALSADLSATPPFEVR